MTSRIMLLSLSDWFGPSRLPQGLHEAGFEVGLLADPAGLFAQSSFIDYRYPISVRRTRLGVIGPILRALTEFQPRIVLPCDEAAVNLLQNLAIGWAGLRGPSRQLPIVLTPTMRELLLRSLGDARSFVLRSRRSQARKLVTEAGIPSPPSVPVPYFRVAETFAEEHGWPVVLTRDERDGGAGARICNDRAALQAAYHEFTSQIDAPPSLRERLSRAWWSLRTLYHLPGDLTVLEPDGPEISIEAVVDGPRAVHAVVAYEGRMLAGLSAVAETVHPEPLGAGTVVRLVQDDEMAETARRLVGRGGFTGFAGLDFVRERSTGQLWFLKFTPRPTSLSHLGSLAGGDLCVALHAAVTGGFPVTQTATRPTRVALFPQDWIRDPLLADSDRHADHLDRPRDDPRLLAALTALIPRGVPARPTGGAQGAVADAIPPPPAEASESATPDAPKSQPLGSIF